MKLALATSWPLWLLAVVPLIVWLARRRRQGLDRRRVVLAAVLRCLALALVALALARPILYLQTHAVSVVYALDLSASMDRAFQRDALDWMQQINAQYRPAHAGYVVFADRAQLLQDLGAVRALALRPPRDAGGARDMDASATDIEQGLAAALLGFLPDHAKRLVLISDGNQTQGDLWRELPRLQAERVRVFAFPAPARFAARTRIDALELSDGVREQQPVTLHVRVISGMATQARLQLLIAGGAASDRSVALAAGENRVPFELRFLRAGSNPVEAKLITPQGELDSVTQSVWVGPRLRLLVVDGGRARAPHLADALASQGIDVTAVSADQFAERPELALRQADVVLLSDVPADLLEGEATRRLIAFVRDLGGGLIFVAGENTFGQEGFAGRGVERLLPVKFEARRKRKELDLVLLVDRSYSMRGRKLEFAKSAALATLDLLERQHRLAVVGFDSQPHDIVPLAEVGNKRRAEDLVSSMTSAGRTNIYNALWRARELLADSPASTKHVILLSDGETAPPPGAAQPSKRTRDRNGMLEMLRGMGYGVGNIERLIGEDAPQHPTSASGGFEDLVAEMAAANITLSTVAIGDKPNLPLMTGLADWGHGKSYVAQRDSEIPGLFAAEARRLLGESLVEEPFRPIARGRSEMLAGLDFASGPELKGFVASKAKRFSDVLLAAKQGQPLLAETRYGLGRSVAFLSDAKNRWAVDWLGWPGYGKFWAQVVRSAARGAATQELAWRVTRHRHEALLTLTALNPDGTFRNDLWPMVRVQRPNGESSVIALRQSAPGTYNARTTLGIVSAAPYRFELLPAPGLTARDIARIGTRALYYAQSDEFRAQPPDVATLNALSERTGGRFAAKAEEIFAPSSDGGMPARSLWPALVCGALLVFLLEIAVRRAPWPMLQARRRASRATAAATAFR
jgi:hypothetical protein